MTIWINYYFIIKFHPLILLYRVLFFLLLWHSIQSSVHSGFHCYSDLSTRKLCSLLSVCIAFPLLRLCIVTMTNASATFILLVDHFHHITITCITSFFFPYFILLFFWRISFQFPNFIFNSLILQQLALQIKYIFFFIFTHGFDHVYWSVTYYFWIFFSIFFMGVSWVLFS